MSSIMWSFLGSIGSALLGGLFGSASTDSTNNANARQAAAQRKWQTDENEKAYQRNRALAEQQNNLNVEQWQRERKAALEDWNRENAYNSPGAQMQRYRDAGLNPNLIYGQSNTSGGMSSPSIAGSMTSGAPATPAAGVAPPQVIPKNFDSMFSRIGDALMNIPIYKEQVRGARLENDLKQIEVNRQNREYGLESWLDTIFTDSSEPMTVEQYSEMTGEYVPVSKAQILNRLRRDYVNDQNGLLNLDKSQFDKKLRDSTFDDLKRDIAAKRQLSEADAEYAIKTLGHRLNKSITDNDWYTFEKWLNVIDKSGELLTDVIDAFGKLGILKHGVKVAKVLPKTAKTATKTASKSVTK